MLTTLLIYLHLLATAFALVELLNFDRRLLRSLHRPLAAADLERLAIARHTVALALAILWITGLWFVVVGVDAEPGVYLSNQKLWMKLFIVALLTINGALMHFVGFGRLRPGVVFSDLPFPQQCILLGMGVFSTVSWLFAAFLGIARVWNHTVSFEHLLVMYGGLLVGGFVAANVLLMLPSIRRVTARTKQVEEV